MKASQTVAQTIASTLDAMQRCQALDANESQRDWAPRHASRLNELVNDYLPSGSGWDSGTGLDYDRSTPNRLVFFGSFHHMTEDGMYDGWTEHTIVVTPNLAFGFELRITGRNRNDIKEYLTDLFHDALSAVVPDEAAR